MPARRPPTVQEYHNSNVIQACANGCYLHSLTALTGPKGDNVFHHLLMKARFPSSFDESKMTAVRQQYHNSLIKLKTKLVQTQQQSSLQTDANKSSGTNTLAPSVPDLASDIANLYM
eukprot:12395-Heterococcus_DN1.PRE.1